MTEAVWHQGDTRDVLKTLPDASVDVVISSPPFLALRSYLPADHPDKHREIGSEPTPGEFLDTLLDVVVELRRVLAPHGSLCIELGDTYSGSGGAGGDYDEDGLRAGQPKFKQVGSREHRPEREGTSADGGARVVPVNAGAGWPLAKSLCLIPQSFAWALAYGRNPFTGRTIEPWRVRNIVRWCRPNPPVGALGDKFRPATSEMTVACVSGQRYFDLDAVRTESVDVRPRNTNGPKNADADAAQVLGHYDTRTTNPAGAPPLDYWVIPTQPYSGSHYATFPEALVVKPIQAMCPLRVCRTCGEPSRRITEPTAEYGALLGEAIGNNADWKESGNGLTKSAVDASNAMPPAERHAKFSTIGWSDCGHDAFRTGVVLDPFAGSGTTLAVAVGHGRDAVGVDLDPRNVELARERIGPMFFREATPEEAA